MDWASRIGRRIRLRDLHILLEVARCGSMARAAQTLAVSQPVVSKAIADLEQIFGVRLLDRDRHGAMPTAYGHALLNRGMAAFDELKQGVKDVEFLLDPSAGEVRIGGTDPMVEGLIPAVIDRLSKQFPRLALHLTRVAGDTQQFRALRERSLEVIITRLPPRMAADLDAEILFGEPLLVAAGITNRWTKRRKIELSELLNEPWVLPHPGNFVGELVEDVFHACRLDPPKTNVVIGGMQTNHALLATGRFLAFYSASVLHFSAKRLAIRPLPVKLPIQTSPIAIVTLKNRTISPVARLVIDCAREITSKMLVSTNKLRSMAT
jgi:DNA-binding transcriptional LysR family regulator